jgi:hypothetical protein
MSRRLSAEEAKQRDMLIQHTGTGRYSMTLHTGCYCKVLVVSPDFSSFPSATNLQ